MGSFAIALRLARREMRGGLKGFRIFLACLTLGVGAIAGVGSLSSAIVESLRSDGRILLGGDVELRLTHRTASPEELAWLKDRATVSTVVQMRAMARNPSADKRMLVELKAIDDLYPLYGRLDLAPDLPLAEALRADGGTFGAVAEQSLLDRLGLKIGDQMSIGEARFTLRGRILGEPDRGTEGLTLGPRVLVAAASLESTGLIQPGSLINWSYRAKISPAIEPHAWAQQASAAFPDAGWRVRDSSNGAPGVKQWVERLGLFLTLVGLTALLVGGVGVGNAVKSYLDGKTETIATLKCLGAPARVIFQVYLIQVLLLTAVGILFGLVLGAALPSLLAQVIGDRLPVSPKLGLYPAPLIVACAYGLFTALAFALWPLARAREIAAAGLFRDLVSPSRLLPRPAYIAAVGLSCVALAALAVLTAVEQRFALGFVAGAAGSFILLRLAAWAVMAAARRSGRPKSPALRIALANLYRPGAATGSVLLSLGLGLTVLVAVALIQGNLSAQVQDRLPAAAPAFFFIDIQPDQVQAFDALAAAIPGVSDIEQVPSLRGRIVRVNRVAAEQAPVASGSRWALRGDRGLTYAPTVPEGSVVVAGQWWPANYQGPPLISLDATIARDMGLGVGDTLTINVLGREIEARIANLRRIDWSSLGINFAIVFAPGTLEAAPHSFIATARAEGAAEPALYKAVSDRFANVSAIRVKEVLAAINGVLEDIGRAVRAAASVTLLAGVLVLAGAMAAGHRHRVYDAVILKVLGATRFDVLRAYILEYALLGLVAGLFAGSVGWLAAWIVVTQVMGSDWVALPGTVLATVAGSLLATVLFGLLGTWRALSQRPAPVLRAA